MAGWSVARLRAPMSVDNSLGLLCYIVVVDLVVVFLSCKIYCRLHTFCKCATASSL